MLLKTLLTLSIFPMAGWAADRKPLDHLRPDDGPFLYSKYPKDYGEIVSRLILTFGRDVRTGVFMLAGDQFIVTALVRNERGEEFVRDIRTTDSGDPQHRIASKPEISMKPLPKECSLKIQKIWREELLRVKYDAREPLVSDGIHYQFYSFGDYGNLSGTTVSLGEPREWPFQSNLQKVALCLSIYATSDTASETKSLAALKAAIERQLDLEAKGKHSKNHGASHSR